MATTTKTPATPKAKKPPVAVAVRLTEQMKRGALGAKLNAEELDKVAALAGALNTDQDSEVVRFCESYGPYCLRLPGFGHGPQIEIAGRSVE